MRRSPRSQFKNKGGFKRIANALIYSAQGLKAAWQHEAAFRQESVLILFLLPCSWFLGRTFLEIVSLAGVLLIVLIIELLNSALEAIADSISTDFHPLIKRAKDMGSAAVLCSLVLASVVWISILWSRFYP